jgi:hypothetical protein
MVRHLGAALGSRRRVRYDVRVVLARGSLSEFLASLCAIRRRSSSARDFRPPGIEFSRSELYEFIQHGHVSQRVIVQMGCLSGQLAGS